MLRCPEKTLRRGREGQVQVAGHASQVGEPHQADRRRRRSDRDSERPDCGGRPATAEAGPSARRRQQGRRPDRGVPTVHGPGPDSGPDLRPRHRRLQPLPDRARHASAGRRGTGQSQRAGAGGRPRSTEPAAGDPDLTAQRCAQRDPDQPHRRARGCARPDYRRPAEPGVGSAGDHRQRQHHHHQTPWPARSQSQRPAQPRQPGHPRRQHHHRRPAVHALEDAWPRPGMGSGVAEFGCKRDQQHELSRRRAQGTADHRHRQVGRRRQSARIGRAAQADRGHVADRRRRCPDPDPDRRRLRPRRVRRGRGLRSGARRLGEPAGRCELSGHRPAAG